MGCVVCELYRNTANTGKLEEECAATVLQEAIKGDLAKNLTTEHRTETLVEEHSRQSRQQMQIP